MKSSVPISRVLSRKISFNKCDVCHLSNPHVTTRLKHSTLRHRAGSPQTTVYANLQPSECTTERSPDGRQSLTSVFSPLPPKRRLFSSALTCRHRQLPVKKRSALCCPDFPLAPQNDASDRPEHCFSSAKIVQIDNTTKINECKIVSHSV